MRKITITLSNPKPQFKSIRSNNRRYLTNECAKCGKLLSPGDTAYRTTRNYLCQTCGDNAEIGD